MHQAEACVRREMGNNMFEDKNISLESSKCILVCGQALNSISSFMREFWST